MAEVARPALDPAALAREPSGPPFRHAIDESDVFRMERAVSEKTTPHIAQYLKKAAPAFGVVVGGVEAVVPHIFQAWICTYEMYYHLPKRLYKLLWGLCVCFFGGRYATAIAAIEAFHSAGGAKMLMWLRELEDEFQRIRQITQKDDMDEHIRQLDDKALAMHKMRLFLRSADPEKLTRAIGGLWSGYIGIVVVLKYQFAKTVALATSIGDHLRPLVAKIFAPSILHLAPQEYHPWVGPLIELGCKSSALLVAWRITRVISTVQSGIQGGLLASRHLFAWLREHNGQHALLREDGLADEVVGWSIAVCGIYRQLVQQKKNPPSLLKPVMIPLDLLETFLEWSISFLTRAEK